MLSLIAALSLQIAAPPPPSEQSACVRLDQAVSDLSAWRAKWRAETLDPSQVRADQMAGFLEDDPQASALSSAVADGLRSEAKRFAMRAEREEGLARDLEQVLGEIIVARLSLCSGASRP